MREARFTRDGGKVSFSPSDERVDQDRMVLGVVCSGFFGTSKLGLRPRFKTLSRTPNFRKPGAVRVSYGKLIISR